MIRSISIFKWNQVFVGEENNPSGKIVILEEELDGIDIVLETYLVYLS